MVQPLCPHFPLAPQSHPLGTCVLAAGQRVQDPGKQLASESGFAPPGHQPMVSKPPQPRAPRVTVPGGDVVPRPAGRWDVPLGVRIPQRWVSLGCVPVAVTSLAALQLYLCQGRGSQCHPGHPQRTRTEEWMCPTKTGQCSTSWVPCREDLRALLPCLD